MKPNDLRTPGFSEPARRRAARAEPRRVAPQPARARARAGGSRPGIDVLRRRYGVLLVDVLGGRRVP